MKKILILGNCQINKLPEYINFKQNNLQLIPCKELWLIDNNNNFNFNLFLQIDILILEINNRKDRLHYKNIIQYINKNNDKCQIIITPLIYLPIFPLNWSGKGLINKNRIRNDFSFYDLDYKEEWKSAIDKFKIYNDISDIDIIPFINENYKTVKLMNDCLHPTSILMNEFIKQVVKQIKNLIDININVKTHIQTHNKTHNKDIFKRKNKIPYFSKMVSDCEFEFEVEINDDFYISKQK